MFKEYLFLLSVLMLSACGGGSSDKNEDVVVVDSDRPIITLSYTTAYVNEGNQIEIPFTVKNDAGEDFIISTRDTDNITTSVIDNKFILDVGLVTGDRVEQPIIIVTDSKGLVGDAKIGVTIKNLVTSDQPLSVYVNNVNVNLLSSIDNNNSNSETITFVVDSPVKHSFVVVFDDDKEKQPQKGTGLTFDYNESNQSITFKYKALDPSIIPIKEYNITLAVISYAEEGDFLNIKDIKVTINKDDTSGLGSQLDYLLAKLQEINFNGEEEDSLLYYLVDKSENQFKITLPESVLIREKIKTKSGEGVELYNIASKATEYLDRINSFNEEISNGSKKVDLDYKNLISSLNQSVLFQEVELAKEINQKAKAEFYQELIEEIANDISVEKPVLFLDKLYNYGRNYSTFVGNSNYGYMDFFSWTPYSEYKFIEGVMLKHYAVDEFLLNEKEEEE
jgi:hypothetical protein